MCGRARFSQFVRILFRIIPEMFHVKHFGKVTAQDLTRPQTKARLARSKTGELFGAIETKRRTRFDNQTPCRNVNGR
jgi:hypothetical protein